ncbi:hypothetical protein [Mucilaginibacter sp.]|uniref:hypothetical protein n=1 Tax=Mucilaginibacter sp. TaxID=1882438 RepID=UPI00345DA1DD
MLTVLGLTILSFENDQILNDIESVLNTIKQYLILLKNSQPSFPLAEERFCVNYQIYFNFVYCRPAKRSRGE